MDTPSPNCQHCRMGRLYKRGLAPTGFWCGSSRWGEPQFALYNYVDIDDGPCPKCNGTGLQIA